MKANPDPRSGKLVQRRDLTSTLAIFRFELEGGVPDFEAGQFIMLGLRSSSGRLLWRAYSIATSPEFKDYVEFYIRLAQAPHKGESFTSELWRMGVGDTLLWKPPRGMFTIADHMPDGSPDDRRLLLVAGGTGLAPFISYVLHLKGVSTSREIVLCHGARHVAELGYRDLLSDLELRSRRGEPSGWRFCYLPTISRPRAEGNGAWQGYTGRVATLFHRRDEGTSVVEQVIGETLDPRSTCIYICGFDGTVSSVLAVVEPMGFRTHKNRRPDGSYDLKFESYA